MASAGPRSDDERKRCGEAKRKTHDGAGQPAWPAGIRILPTVRGVALSQRSAIGSQASATRPNTRGCRNGALRFRLASAS